MQILDLINDFSVAPEPWESRTIPWDEPGFSHRMLREHLSQAHDGASRRAETIDRHVEFIERLLPDRPARVLDLGCGPGLYTLRLARRGHECLGVDFSPASIDYARDHVEGLASMLRYELADIRAFVPRQQFDLVMLLYGELNLFPPQEMVAILRRWRTSLAPGGRILLEVHGYDFVRARGQSPPRIMAYESGGLFSDLPHLRIDESFWLADDDTATGRHWIIDGATGDVTRHGWTMQAYDDAAYESLLREAGLEIEARFGDLSGGAEASVFPVLLAGPG